MGLIWDKTPYTWDERLFVWNLVAIGGGGNFDEEIDLQNYYDTIPINDIKKNAVIVASFVYHTAMLEKPLPRKKNKK